MKRFLFLLVFFPSSLLFGQSQIGFFGSADLTNCNYGLNSFNGSIRNSKEVKFNTHFGVNYYQNLKGNTWLKIGLGVTSTGYQEGTTRSGIRYGSQHDGEGGFNPNLPFEEINIKYDHYFLELPVALRFDFSNKKLAPFIEIGISTMYYLQTVSVLETQNISKSVDRNRSNQINQIQFAPTFTFGCRYNLNEKWTVSVQPNIRYHLTKMVDTPSTGEHQWGIGLGLGLQMNLK